MQLTPAERERFLEYLDHHTAEAERAKHATKMTDPLSSVSHELKSYNFRVVALHILLEQNAENRMRLQTMDPNPSIKPGPQDVGANADG